MQVSLYSLLMSVAWGTLFTIVLCLFRRFKRGSLYYNIAPLSILLVGCLVRCFLPLEFPGFSVPVTSSAAYAAVNTHLYSTAIPLGDGGGGITPLQVFFMTWAVGALLMIGYFLINYCKKVHRLVHVYEEVESGPIYDAAWKIAEKLNISRLTIVTDPSIKGPCVIGFLYPRVMLPETPYTQAELEYILMHELGHWKNGDMTVRLLTNLICYLFWWNPFIYLLKYRLEETLEFQCDATLVTAKCLPKDGDERLDYLSTLQRVIDDCRAAKEAAGSSSIATALEDASLFTVESNLVTHPMSKEDFKRRLDIIGDYIPNPRKERRVAIFTAAIMSIVLVFSYKYIFQPYYYAPEEDFSTHGGDQRITNSDTYLILESNGEYSVYVDGKYFSTATSKGAQQMMRDGFPLKTKIEE